jgi:hypothetical protein
MIRFCDHLILSHKSASTLPKSYIQIYQSNSTNHHNQMLIALIALIMVLVTGIYAMGILSVFAGTSETTGTLLIHKICEPSSISCINSFNVQVEGNNPQPSKFSLADGESRSVTLGQGNFKIIEAPAPVSGFTTSFSGDCKQPNAGYVQAIGTISVGQHLVCTVKNHHV